MVEIYGRGKNQDIGFKDPAADQLPVIPGNGTPPEHIAPKAAVAGLQVELMGTEHLQVPGMMTGPFHELFQEKRCVPPGTGAPVERHDFSHKVWNHKFGTIGLEL
jgi:hypothetical protein